MRILVIRGRNLASLAGDFEVRLDAPPLGDAGLFAITGKTGAGKSTILDAMCLALYDKMPRLLGGSGFEVGRADDAPGIRLKNNDARSILRRGTGEGYAEVEFLGVDGRRYRTRWSVRRARRRAGGRFQFQDMGLWDLDADENLGGNKTDVLARIEERLGLTFDQFRRSVLLAQGDFAAFLRANPKERAELLERITGTAIYSRLSAAAHRRAAEEKRQLELIGQRLGEHHPLDEVDRKELEKQVESAHRRLDELRRKQEGLQQAERWYRTLSQFVSEHEQAISQLTEAGAAFAATEPRRQAWERIRTLQSLRLPLNEFDKAKIAVNEARQVLEINLVKEQRLQTEMQRAEAAVKAAEDKHGGAEKAQRDATPRLREARRIDTQIQGAGENLGRVQKDRGTVEAALKTIVASHRELKGEQEQISKSLGEASEWLATNPGLQPVAAHWDAWERELGRFAEARGERDQAAEVMKKSQRHCTGLKEQREKQAKLLEAICADRDQAESQGKSLATQAGEYDLEHLAEEREGLAERQRTLEKRHLLVEQAGEVRHRITNQQGVLSLEQGAQRDNEGRIQALGSDLKPLQGALEEAEANHQRLLVASAGDVETLRRQLRAGEACPVCGAEEHPWAHQTAGVLQGLAQEQAEHVAGLKAKLQDLSVEQTRRGTELAQSLRRQSELGVEISGDRNRLTELLDAWSASEVDELHPPDPFQGGLFERIETALSALTPRLQKISADETQARSLAARIDMKRIELEHLRARLDQAQKQLEDIDKETSRTVQEHDQAERDRKRAEQALSRVTRLIAEPFSGIENWVMRLEADPMRFLADCRGEVADWQRAETQRDAAQGVQRTLEPRLTEAAIRKQTAEAELTQCSDKLTQRKAVLAELHGQRNRLLGGRPADAVEQELERAISQAHLTLEEARGKRDQTRQVHTAIQSRNVTQRQALAKQEQTATKAMEELDARMRNHTVTQQELRQALEHDHDWLEQERIAIDAFKSALHTARGLAKERARKLEGHRISATPELPREDVATVLGTLAEEIKASQEDWGKLHARRIEDDQKRKTTESIQYELDLQRARWQTWESLRELIGSADGSKFRNFAQGLTLDLLVAHANVHLRDLARRYLLQRSPGTEMELQVIDREMGDEVRGIHSLSGGESFLVSLALALGLASLASDRVQVESLFIDEGFGALDTDSLDMAIASLDSLYSLGRQVGVISHVATLVERIGVKVQVAKEGGGRSRLKLVAG